MSCPGPGGWVALVSRLGQVGHLLRDPRNCESFTWEWRPNSLHCERKSSKQKYHRLPLPTPLYHCSVFLEKEVATHSSILAWRIPHGQRSLAVYGPWGHKELDMTERLTLCVSASIANENCLYHHLSIWGFPGGLSGKESACQCRRPRFNPWVWTTHSSILAREIPWTEEPGGLQSGVIRRVGYDLILNKHKKLNNCLQIKSIAFRTMFLNAFCVSSQYFPVVFA